MSPGEMIIKQGDRGDCLFIVEKGELECSKKFPGNKTDTYLKTYTSGEAFGELALLYNAPRAANIKAKTNGTLFKLDRDTFTNIVSKGAQARREKYEKFLRKMDIFSTLDDYEITNLSEALRKCEYKKGDLIIKKGDVGDCFYILEEGKAIAYLDKEGVNDFKYEPGGYFGELALLKDQPRMAYIKAVTDVSVLSLDRDSFKRILGPIQDALKRREELYKKYVKK